jgi:hypothetical protein
MHLMNTLQRSEIAVLIFGWLTGIFFLFYSEGIFDSSHQWTLSDVDFSLFALVFAVPYALAGLFCWQLRRFGVPFFVGSVILVVVSTWAYYSTYFPRPEPDAGWVFLIVAAIQTFLVCAFSGIIFIVKKLLKSQQ